MDITVDAIGAVANGTTAVVAALAAWFGVREYRRAGQWKAAELAAAHLRLLTTDETLVFACQAIDWGTGPLVVPTVFRAIAGTETIQHDVRILETAMKPRLDRATLDDPRGLLYRNCLDKFFGFLDGAQEMLDLGLVQRVHLLGLRYWLRHLANWVYAYQAKRNEVFLPFLIACGYGRVLRLFDSLGVAVEIPPTEDDLAKKLKEDAAPR